MITGYCYGICIMNPVTVSYNETSLPLLKKAFQWAVDSSAVTTIHRCDLV